MQETVDMELRIEIDQIEKLMQDYAAATEGGMRFADVLGASNVSFAAQQGAHAFYPSMLPRLWHSNLCPYRQQVFKQAWYRGFYSAACWYLIDRIAALGRTWSPDLGQMFSWYCEDHPRSDWVRVPGGEAHASV